MKISKRTREQAWLICAIGASSGRYECVADIEDQLGTPEEEEDAGLLSCRAYHSPKAARWPIFSPERYAEAAALLAEGWCPP